MKNKIQFKKTITLSFFVVILFCITSTIANYYEYKTYTNNFNQKIDMLITKTTDNYPDINQNEIVEILNSNESDKNKNLLSQYGIDLSEDSAVLQNDIYFEKFIKLNVCITLIFAVILILVFLFYNKRKDKRLKEITRYVEEINKRNYKLDIDDNTEDELSILKNEIYKTTVMLKESAENSLNDKINLKESLSDISHQLKTPLTSIIIMLDNILDNKNMDIQTRDDFIKNIQREVKNISFLVESLLKLSKFDTNNVKFINKEEYIKNILEESIKNVSMLCDLKNIEINIRGDKNLKVNCDFKWQVEAITNILKNCIEHSNPNSIININYSKNKMYSKIEIKDSGKGIDEDDLPHIFERFYKGKNSSNDSVGIGLALAKSIIENNNGYISADSKINKGSTFTIKYLQK